MTMTFDEAFAALNIGDTVVVSDGNPKPSVIGALPYNIWLSHNFTGEVVSKSGTTPRSIKFSLPRENDAVISFTIVEGTPHNFEMVAEIEGGAQ